MSLIAVFIASLIGSPHCAGMCGGFVAFFSVNSDAPTKSQLSYHLGRLLSYSIVGSLAGIIGQSLNSIGLALGLQRASGYLMGALLIYWGTRGLLGYSLGRTWNGGGEAGSGFYRMLFKFYQAVTVGGKRFAWTTRSFCFGILSALLPCGWLYAFAAVAATTASWFYGGIVMAVFWLGTVPILVAVAGVSRYLGERLQTLSPKIASALLIIAGLASLFGHYNLLPFIEHHHHHH